MYIACLFLILNRRRVFKFLINVYFLHLYVQPETVVHVVVAVSLLGAVSLGSYELR